MREPARLADLREGEVVLHLASCGGIDVLLSARHVGPAGKAYGLDMTEEMRLYATNRGERPRNLAVRWVCHLTPQCNSSRSR